MHCHRGAENALFCRRPGADRAGRGSLTNRAYFAAAVSNRGDEFYNPFTERHNALLAEQEAGTGAFYVLLAEDGSVLGRFNLYRLQDGTAELGYRVAERVAGRGLATARPCGSCADWGVAARPARAQGGGDQQRERRVPEGADQGRVRPGWPSRPRRRSSTLHLPHHSVTWPMPPPTRSATSLNWVADIRKSLDFLRHTRRKRMPIRTALGPVANSGTGIR